MSGRRVKLPAGAKFDDHGHLVMPEKKPRDASEAIRMKKSKKSRPVSKAAARMLNTIRGK